MNTNAVALFGFIVSYTKKIKFQKQLHDYTTKCSTENKEWHLWHDLFCQVWFQCMSSNHRNLHIYIKFLFSMTSCFCTIWPWTVLNFKCIKLIFDYIAFTGLQANSQEQYFASKLSAWWDSPIREVLRAATICFQVGAQLWNRLLSTTLRQSPGSEWMILMSLSESCSTPSSSPMYCHFSLTEVSSCVTRDTLSRSETMQ